MIYKQQTKSINLLIMESLYRRMKLTGKGYYYYLNLDKGFVGEVKLDRCSELAPGERLLLGDLFLKAGGKSRQIDALVITSKAALLYEVKNFEGEYIYKDDRVFRIGLDKPLFNPFSQLDEAETLLRQVFSELGIQLPVQSFVVFVNPNMTLYQAPQHPNLLMASNLDKHFEDTGKGLTRLTSQHKSSANKLCELCMPELRSQSIPEYTFEELRKGVTCAGCGSFIHEMTPKKSKYCCCTKCGHKEIASVTLDRHIDECALLFPDLSLTSVMIHYWCGGLFELPRIRAHLKKRFKVQGKNRWTTYI